MGHHCAYLALLVKCCTDMTNVWPMDLTCVCSGWTVGEVNAEIGGSAVGPIGKFGIKAVKNKAGGLQPLQEFTSVYAFEPIVHLLDDSYFPGGMVLLKNGAATQLCAQRELGEFRLLRIPGLLCTVLRGAQKKSSMTSSVPHCLGLV